MLALRKKNRNLEGDHDPVRRGGNSHEGLGVNTVDT
jgi:hypothetical protein